MDLSRMCVAEVILMLVEEERVLKNTLRELRQNPIENEEKIKQGKELLQKLQTIQKNEKMLSV